MNALTLTTHTATTPTPSLVRTDDEMQHIEDTPLFTAIRNHQFVELPWNELDDSERRAIHINLFNPNGF